MRFLMFILIIFVSFSAQASDYGILYPAKVLYVIDGDTISVNWNGSEEKVRFLEVDTFEVRGSRSMSNDMKQFRLSKEKLKQLGNIGSHLTKKLIHKGDTVWLSFEGKKRGYYKRLLAFVHLKDGRVLNELLISTGAALVYGRSRNGTSHHLYYLNLESQSISQKNGVWKNNNVNLYYK